MLRLLPNLENRAFSLPMYFSKQSLTLATRRLRALLTASTILAATTVPVRAQATIAWTEPTRGVSIAVDASDNVFTVDYEQQLGRECEVTKRDVSGTHLWTASIDQPDATKWERAQWIAVDSTGAAIVCATLMSGFSNPVVAASVVMKFGPDGTPLWRVVYENGFDGTSTRKCLIDEQDNIYVLGTGIGTSTLTAKIKKLAPDGSTIWTYLDTAGVGVPSNVKFAGDGDLVLAGRAVFGSINGYAKVDRDTGMAQWSLTGVSSLTVGDLAGDAAGNTYVVHGEFVTNGGTVVRKLGPSGTQIWSQTFASVGSRVEVGPDQRPVVSGFPSSGGAGAAFFKVDANGGLVWSNLDADGPLLLLLHGQLLLDGGGNAYLAAGLLGSMAVCKVHSDGTSAWTVTMPGGSGAQGIALGRATASVFVVGGTTVRLADPIEIGSTYCGPSTANSTGAPASLTARGSDLVARNDVLLVAERLPLNVTAMFLNAPLQGLVANAGGSQGTLCLAGPIGRYNGPNDLQNSGLLGRVELRLDLTRTSTPTGLVAILSGSTWNFQCWYRDLNPPATSNFTDGVQITYL